MKCMNAKCPHHSRTSENGCSIFPGVAVNTCREKK